MLSEVRFEGRPINALITIVFKTLHTIETMVFGAHRQTFKQSPHKTFLFIPLYGGLGDHLKPKIKKPLSQLWQTYYAQCLVVHVDAHSHSQGMSSVTVLRFYQYGWLSGEVTGLPCESPGG